MGLGREAALSTPKVRIGIVSWNTRELLEECLRSLPAATEGLDAEVVVVDNDSADGSADAAALHPGVRVIRNATNVGYARAMNQALSGGDRVDVLVALNPDTRVPPGTLTALTARLMSDPSVGLVAPRLVHPDGSPQHSAYRFPSLRLSLLVALAPGPLQRGRLARRFWLEGRAGHEGSTDVDWVIGAVHLMRAEAVEREKPYNERWFMYVEDLDLCWALARDGWRRRLEGDLVVVHAGGASARRAWGDQVVPRWLDGSYDWYALRRGVVPAVLWGMANLSGVALHRQGRATFGRHWKALRQVAGAPRGRNARF